MTHVIKRFKFKIECVQTDDGVGRRIYRPVYSEKNKPTLFDKVLEVNGIKAQADKAVHAET